MEHFFVKKLEKSFIETFGLVELGRYEILNSSKPKLSALSGASI